MVLYSFLDRLENPMTHSTCESRVYFLFKL